MTHIDVDSPIIGLGADQMKSDLKELARWISLGACAGGLGGFLVGGIGGRLAMFLLRVTTDASIRGIDSDDGFRMGVFTLNNTLSLLLVTTVLGSIGGLIVVFGRPFLPARYTWIGWPVAAGAIVGATIIKDDGVDFNLLEPAVLAVLMFIAIPAAGAFLIVWLIERWQKWWWTDWKRTIFAAFPGLPTLMFFPIGIAVVIIAAVWLVALQIRGVRSLPRMRPIRVLAVVVFGVLTSMGLFSLGNDVRDVL